MSLVLYVHCSILHALIDPFFFQTQMSLVRSFVISDSFKLDYYVTVITLCLFLNRHLHLLLLNLHFSHIS